MYSDGQDEEDEYDEPNKSGQEQSQISGSNPGCFSRHVNAREKSCNKKNESTSNRSPDSTPKSILKDNETPNRINNNNNNDYSKNISPSSSTILQPKNNTSESTSNVRDNTSTSRLGVRSISGETSNSQEDYMDNPPIKYIRVLRPSNDLSSVRFDSHFNIIQAVNDGSLEIDQDMATDLSGGEN
jgi:hypothetical protein